MTSIQQQTTNKKPSSVINKTVNDNDICSILSDKLPTDILRMIYLNYFHIKYKYKKLCGILYGNDCMNLRKKGCIDLSYYVKSMLNEDTELLKYALKFSTEKDKFKNVFEMYVINNNDPYYNIKCYYEAFAFSWMMYLYH